MNFVDFDEIVAECATIIGGDEETAKAFSKQWIWSGLKHLGTTDDMIEVCRIDAKNFLLKKPKNLQKIDDIALFDVNGIYIPHKFHSGVKRIHPNVDSFNFTITTDQTNTVTFNLPVDISENRHSIVIGSNGSRVSFAWVRYYAYPIDENGLPLIREDETEALKMYVRYQWSLRKNENQSEIQVNKFSWQEAADHCRAAKKASEFSNESRKNLTSILNRQIPNFNKSRF